MPVTITIITIITGILAVICSGVEGNANYLTDVGKEPDTPVSWWTIRRQERLRSNNNNRIMFLLFASVGVEMSLRRR